MEKEILKRVIEYRDYCLKMCKYYDEEEPLKAKWLNALETTNIVLEIIETVIRIEGEKIE